MIDVEEFKMKEILKIEESDSNDELTVTFTAVSYTHLTLPTTPYV